MGIIRNKKIFFGLSVVLLIASFVLMFGKGLPLSIDFTGGSILEVTYTVDRPEPDTIRTSVEMVEPDAQIAQTGATGVIVRTPFLGDDGREALLAALEIDGAIFTEDRFSSIGPSIGEELKRKAFIAIALVVLMIILYVAFAFRRGDEEEGKQVKGPSSWTYGVVAIAALLHDIIIPTGFFALMGLEVDTLFVMALLAILGFSVNDTIVVFDRIRENLRDNADRKRSEEFATTVGKSLQQTYVRSINTSLTTLLVLIVLFVVTGSAIHNFVLTLIIGVIAGTYSSIFLASPLLVWFENRKQRKS